MTNSYRDMQKKIKKYSKKNIEQMRTHLALSEYEALSERDIKEILWDGCLGWAMMNDEDIIEMYEETFGELEELS